MDRANLRVFFIMTHNCAGGLPIGCFITSSESEATLKLYLTLTQSNAFGRRGAMGPVVFMIDDCEESVKP